MNAPDHIRSWLESNGLGEYAPIFEENHITLAMLPKLTGDDICEMGITSLGHRKALLAAISESGGEVWATPVAALAVPDPSPGSAPEARGLRPRPMAVSVPVVAEAAKAGVLPEPDATLVMAPKAKRKGFSPGFLSVSIGLHVVLGLLATYWVVQTIQAERKLQFKAGPPNPSPNTRALEHKVSMKKKNSGGAPAQPKRIAVAGMTANVTLPDMPTMPSMSGQIALGQMSGMGGAGFGQGLGFGNGAGSGMGGGMGKGGFGLTMFGARGGVGLTGYFYDLKQTKDGKPTELAPMANEPHSLGDQYLGILKEFAEDWDTRLLEKYYRSQKALIASQIYVTNGPSDEAAKAFGEDKNCVGSGWIVHYRGSAIAPKDGSFRFIGLGDNVLLLRLNGKIVLDFGSSLPSNTNTAADLGPAGPDGWKLVGGAWFDVRRGDTMKLEVLIGDYGGLFSDYLFIEEKGVKYGDRSDAPGFPAYPIFQLSPTDVPKDAGKNGNPVPAKERLVFPASGSNNPMDLFKR